MKHVEKQNKELRRFKDLTEEWIDLALLIAQTELEEAKRKLKKQAENSVLSSIAAPIIY